MLFPLLDLLLIVSSALAGNSTMEPIIQPPAALRFLLLGDWGKGGSTGAYGSSINDDSLQLLAGDNKNKKTFNQLAVAAAMGSYAASAQPSFVVALGDNFYSNGVSSSTDVLWSYLWKDVYLPHAALAVPWYPVFGNHDYGGGAAYVRAQLQRTQEHLDDDIWQFEASNYTKTFPIEAADPDALEGTARTKISKATVQIIFLDTTTLAPSTNKCCNENGGVSKEIQAERIADQLSRITAVLEEAQANPSTWLLVVGHYPVYSAGSNGDNAELQMYLLPLLVKYKVHAYICGHDHISEHLQAQGIEFFVAGAGSMTDKLGSAGSKGALIWSGVGYSAFGAVTATASTLNVQFIDTNGTATYNYTLTNPNPLPEEPEPEPEPEEPTDPAVEDSGDEASTAAEGLATAFLLRSSGLVVVGMLGLSACFFCGSKSSFKKRKAGGPGEGQQTAKKVCSDGKPKSYSKLEGTDAGDGRRLRSLEEGRSQFQDVDKRLAQQTVDSSDEEEYFSDSIKISHV